MKATITLAEAKEGSRTVEVSADLYNEAGQVTDDILYDDAVQQLRCLVDAVVSTTYGYHRKVE